MTILGQKREWSFTTDDHLVSTGNIAKILCREVIGRCSLRADGHLESVLIRTGLTLHVHATNITHLAYNDIMS